jgi:hypothetical protein
MAEELDRSQGRAAQETQRRRRRGDEVLSASKRLPIPPEIEAKLKANGLSPRWVNDEGNRMHRFTVLDDYDKVDGVDPVPVGTAEDGKPILAHLLAKPTEFIREDQEKAEERRKGVEDALFRTPDATDQAVAGRNPNPASAQRYVASESKIGRANQVLDG